MISKFKRFILPTVFSLFALTLFATPASAMPTTEAGTSAPSRNIMLVLPDTIYDPDTTQLPQSVGWARFGGMDIFVGAEIDLVGIFGVELGGGIVIDLDTPLDSGIYISVAAAGGLNVGVGVGGGVVINGDLEGQAVAVDGNFGPGSGVIGVGEDGGVLVGGSYGPGVGGSMAAGETGTLSIQNVIDFFRWLLE